MDEKLLKNLSKSAWMRDVMLVGRGLERLDRSRSHHILSQEEVMTVFWFWYHSPALFFSFYLCMNQFSTNNSHWTECQDCVSISAGFRWQEERPPPGQSWRSQAPSRTFLRLSGDSSTLLLSTSMTTHSFAYHPPFPSSRFFHLGHFHFEPPDLKYSESQAAGLVQ